MWGPPSGGPGAKAGPHVRSATRSWEDRGRVNRRVRVIPGRRIVAVLAAGAIALLIALIAGVPVRESGWAAAALLALTTADYARSRTAWRRAAPRMVRRLPAAFAIGVRREIHLSIELEGNAGWSCELHDHADPSLAPEGLPLRLALSPNVRLTSSYAVVPTRRGTVTFAPAEI